MQSPPVSLLSNRALLRLQRACDCSGAPNCDCDTSGEKKEKGALHRSAASSAAPRTAPPIVHETLRSQGTLLDPDTRAFFENRFGYDFSAVRIHADARASESARAVNALAYTVGSDVAFAQGRYAPSTGEGRRLLAHELTHVVQQNGARASGPLVVSTPDDSAETEASNVEYAIRSNDASTSTARSVQLYRQDDGKDSGHGATKPSAPPSGGTGLCAANSSEAFYAKSPGYCRDTASSGSMHAGHTCYREIPSGTGCPSGKHVCFTNGSCDAKESHVDSTAPSITRNSSGMCDLSYLGGCSILHGFLDVIPALVAEGAEAQARCLSNCQKQPWYIQGACVQGCGGAPAAF